MNKTKLWTPAFVAFGLGCAFAWSMPSESRPASAHQPAPLPATKGQAPTREANIEAIQKEGLMNFVADLAVHNSKLATELAASNKELKELKDFKDGFESGEAETAVVQSNTTARNVRVNFKKAYSVKPKVVLTVVPNHVSAAVHWHVYILTVDKTGFEVTVYPTSQNYATILPNSHESGLGGLKEGLKDVSPLPTKVVWMAFGTR